MRNARSKHPHTHDGTRPTIGCPACIDTVRFDQVCAAIDMTDTLELYELVAERYGFHQANPRRVIAYARLELYKRRQGDEYGGDAA